MEKTPPSISHDRSEPSKGTHVSFKVEFPFPRRHAVRKADDVGDGRQT
jgi:hypothetical protein